MSISGIARDCGVARTTVQGYLDILEDTLLAVRLPAFQPRLRVRERRHPKLYWVDPGLVRAVKKLRGPIAPEERGALLEGWILHLPAGARRGERAVSTSCATGRPIRRTAPRSTSCSAGEASWRRSRSSRSRGITTGMLPGVARHRGAPGTGAARAGLRRRAVFPDRGRDRRLVHRPAATGARRQYPVALASIGETPFVASRRKLHLGALPVVEEGMVFVFAIG